MYNLKNLPCNRPIFSGKMEGGEMLSVSKLCLLFLLFVLLGANPVGARSPGNTNQVKNIRETIFEFRGNEVNKISLEIHAGNVAIKKDRSNDAMTKVGLINREGGDNCEAKVEKVNGDLQISIKKVLPKLLDCHYDIVLSSASPDAPVFVNMAAGKLTVDGIYKSIDVNIGAGSYIFSGSTPIQKINMSAGKMKLVYESLAPNGLLQIKANSSKIKGIFPRGSRLNIDSNCSLSNIKSSFPRSGVSDAFKVIVEGNLVSAKFE